MSRPDQATRTTHGFPGHVSIEERDGIRRYVHRRDWRELNRQRPAFPITDLINALCEAARHAPDERHAAGLLQAVEMIGDHIT